MKSEIKNSDLIFLDGSHCNCKVGDIVIHQRTGQPARELIVVQTHGKPKEGKAPIWWIRHCESYGDIFLKKESCI